MTQYRTASIVTLICSALAFGYFAAYALQSPILDVDERASAKYLENVSPSFSDVQGKTLFVLSFGHQGYAGSAVLRGFANPEHWGRWSIAKVSAIELKKPQFDQAILELHFRVLPYLFPPKLTKQTVDVFLNGDQISTWIFTIKHESTRVLKIPADRIADNDTLRIEFRIGSPTRPKDMGENDDPRELGLGLVWLKTVGRQADDP